MNLKNTSLFKFATDKKTFPGLQPEAPSWWAWNVLFRVYSRMSLNAKQEQFFERVTGGLSYSRTKFNLPQNWLLIIGRGGGKTRFISRLLTYRALSFNEPLHPGQTAKNVVIAPSIPAGMTGFEYVAGMLEENERLYKMLVPSQPWQNPIVKNRQQAELRFENGTGISLMPVARVSGRSVSLYTLVLEEAAHFKTDLASRFSDEEIYKSARPALARFGTKSMCLIVTTPFSKEGLTYKLYRKFYGKPNDQWLVIQGSSQTFNPTLDPEFLRQEEEADPEYFAREYRAEFSETFSGAFSPDAISDCVAAGRRRLPYNSQNKYFGFIDPASLSRSASAKFNDEFVAGVAHCDGGAIVIDAILAWSAETDGRRVTPDDAVAQSIALFRSYHVQEVQGDRFASGYIEHKFVDAGFTFSACKLTKSDLYLQLLPLINDGKIQLLDDAVCIAQLKGIERRRGRGGRERFDHLPEKHDDRSNVVAGLVYLCSSHRATLQPPKYTLSDIRIGGPRGATSELGSIGSAADEFKGMM